MKIEMIKAKIDAIGQPPICGMTLSADPGDILAITGSTCQARSAVLLSMLGIMPIAEGCVSIDCEPVTKHTGAFYRRKISFLPHELNFGEEKVADVLDYELYLQANNGRLHSKEEIADELRKLSVPADVLSQPFTALDAAIAQRAALAIIGLQRRSLLILDDPTSQQDEDGTIAIMSYLCSPEMKAVTTVVATDHPAILSVCNKVIKINN